MRRVLCGVGISLCICVVLAGCASIVKGTSQSVSITSNVDGATLYLDGEEIGTTPFNGKIKKNKSEIRIEKAGYRTETIVLSKTIEGMFWGNIIIGGTIGSITDFATGAAYSYAPATYQIDLKGDGQALLDYQHELAVRKFSMIYINRISQDLAGGNGEYLSTLVALLDRREDVSSTAEHIRSALRASRGNQVRFGQAMIDLI